MDTGRFIRSQTVMNKKGAEFHSVDAPYYDPEQKIQDEVFIETESNLPPESEESSILESSMNYSVTPR